MNPTPIVITDFLTKDEEDSLIQAIDLDHWVPNRTGSRKVQIYGPYHDKQYKIIPGKFSFHPKHIQDLATKTIKTIKSHAVVKHLVDDVKWNPQQLEVYINDFQPNSGLKYHFDHRTTYDELICGISLTSDSVLSFKKGKDIIEVPIPQRSLYLMFGPSRKSWKHGIQPHHVTGRRVSVTFRTVK